MKIDELIAAGAARLQAAGLGDPRAEAALLLGDLLDMNRLALRAAGDRVPEPTVARAFEARIERRIAREPAAYILGYREFYEHRFRVTPDVLVPRPETETLVETALAAGLPENARVLDLCCGSGCVGVSLQAARPDWRIVCADLSAAALDIARENARTILGESNLPHFIESDLFAGLPEDARAYDAILCNPPYIHPDEAPGLAPELTYEPRLALYHEEPVEFGVRILEGAAARLVPGGHFLMETGPRYASTLAEKAVEFLHNPRVIHDFYGLERFIRAESRE